MRSNADFFGDELLAISRNIARSGFHMTSVGFGRCSVPGCDCPPSPMPWVYTVGFCALDAPELVTIGVDEETSAHFMHIAYDRLRMGEPLAEGVVHEIDTDVFRVERVADAWLARDPNRMAMWLNHFQVGRSNLALPSVSQLVFSDGNGRFPDDPDCEEWLRASQPRLAADPLNFPPPANRAARRRAGRHLRSIR
jgi:hypothetical protein